MPSFLLNVRHLSFDDANLYWDVILPRTSKPNKHSRDLLHIIQSYDMAADFLQYENSPTWAGIDTATLGAEGQQQINHATQPSNLKTL
ncbi:hypothetical protein TNCV_756961 [Trichonephila clavipes]|nr:hypothetical protein TNCV_756961 [Trichonephila clavipes]